uniref:RIIa domain-containing protein n=1 Tax=Romanomermis culicivorax TaxID=13658 RepID=A0A915JHS6_ROMCU
MSAKIIIPDGLRPLLESLAREIIRNQPTDIYLFSSLFFDTLLKLKLESGGQNPVDYPELYEKFKSRLVKEAINRGLRVQKVSLLISSSDQKEKPINVDQAATKIQAAARGFISRRRVKNQRPDLESARTTRQFANDAYDPRRPSKRLLAKRNSDAQISKIFVAPQNLQATKRASYTSPATSTITEEDAAATKIQANPLAILTSSFSLASTPLRSISNIETGEPSKNNFQKQFMEPFLRIDDVDTSASKIQAGI